MKKKSKSKAHASGNAMDDVNRHMAADPELAALVHIEMERLAVARAVRLLREKKKVTQAQLAQMVGTGQPSIARLESGQVVPRLDFLSRVARALGARVDVRFV